MAVLGPPVVASAQPPFEPEGKRASATTTTETPDNTTQFAELRNAAIRLPLGAGLACLLALRPRRRGTPPRQPPVIQTQIILAIVGAVVMLVVGSSLARAFGIVGAAGLVRYRAKIEDPKDAGVMLSTLAIGLASGVGLWMIAIFGTAFIMLVLWIVESIEPTARKLFTLKVKAKDPAAVKSQLEGTLTGHRVKFELRGTSQEELHYEVRIPFDRKADGITDAILALAPDNVTAADLEEKKDKK
ncbi:MAG TPA: DUF4956 domain-containing protein [Vicinamibacterales bacterium]|nr:DUF4956 domain-containing protein [Vicinamibacterales bacterium]